MESTQGKTVKMTTPNQETPKQEKGKISYEDLERLAYQLSEQAKQMKVAIEERDKVIDQLKHQLGATNNVFARLEFLFDVIKNSNVKFGETFAQQCVEEVEKLMEIPENPPTENTEENEGKEDAVQAD